MTAVVRPTRPSLGRGLFVAASNASAADKAAADYVCSGVADEVQINVAITALPAAGGVVRLSNGNFTIAATVAVPSYVTLRGEGRHATVITGVAGMTATMLTLGASFSVLESVRIIAPTTLTNDAVTFANESDGTTVRDVQMSGGGNATIWMLSVRSSYRFRLDNVFISTDSNGINIVNDGSAYNVGNSCVSQVEVWTTTTGRTAWQISGSTAALRSENLISFSYIAALCSVAHAAGSVGLNIINSYNLAFHLVDLENAAISLNITGSVGSGPPSYGLVFTGLYASGAASVVMDANTKNVTVAAGNAGGAAIGVDDTNGAGGVSASPSWSFFGPSITTAYLMASNGGNAGVASTTASSAGSGGNGMIGTSGGAAGANSAGAARGVGNSPTIGGGGGGGFASGGNNELVGGTSSWPGPFGYLTLDNHGAVHAAGGVGVFPPIGTTLGGAGGGGGGSGNGVVGGAGGNGTSVGAGGGGGGASTNGFASGKGGDGGPGLCIITTIT
jgi:hypothetical protein